MMQTDPNASPPGDQRRTGVKPYFGVTRNQRVRHETGVMAGILDFHYLGLQNGVSSKSLFPGSRKFFQAYPGFGPLAVNVDQGNGGNG